MLWFLDVIDLLVHCHHQSIDYVSNMAVPFEVMAGFSFGYNLFIYYCCDDADSMQTRQSDHCSNQDLM